MKTSKLIPVLLAAGFLASASAQQINFQGRLTDAQGNPVAGPQATLTFSIWDAAAPGAGQKVWGDFPITTDIINSSFSVKLGTASGNDGNGVFLKDVFGGQRYLEIKVGNAPPLPRQQVLYSPASLYAEKAGTVVDGAISTAQLADDAVTGDKIANNTIPVSKLTGAGANFWDGNGTSVWRTTGNVGIGVAFPTARLFVEGATAENALRVRVGGMTKLTVDGNGGVSVGTGNTPPPNGLLVAGHTVASGNMDISGNITEKGQQVTSGAEDLRLIRGIVNFDGSRRSGAGFSSTLSTSSGFIYTITYQTAFASGDIPVVTANVLSTNGGDLPGVINSSTNTGFVIRFGAQNITRTSQVPFNFIVVGSP